MRSTISSCSGGQWEEDRTFAVDVPVFSTKHVVQSVNFMLKPRFLLFLPALAAHGQTPVSSLLGLLGKRNHGRKLRRHYLHLPAASHGGLQLESGCRT